MTDLTERLIRLRDAHGTISTQYDRDTLADAVNALADAEALREALRETDALLSQEISTGERPGSHEQEWRVNEPSVRQARDLIRAALEGSKDG